MASLTRKELLAQLIEINVEDLFHAFGVDKATWSRRALRPFFWFPASRFAHIMLRFDQIVGANGLAAGSEYILHRFQNTVLLSGVASIPRSGPLLLVANHPGLTDAPAIFAHCSRSDLKTIAARRQFLSALPNTERHLIYVDKDTRSDGLHTMRAAIQHLRGGGALLTFPGGQIEPDPALRSDASDALDTWSNSIDLFARLVPGLQIVPVLVSGVLSARAQRNPLIYLHRTRREREWLAATLQIIVPSYRAVTVRLDFGRPLIPDAEKSSETPTIAVRSAMSALLGSLP